MKIDDLIKELQNMKANGFTEIRMYNDGYYEDFDVTTKIITPCLQERIEVFGQPLDMEAVKQQYHKYGSNVTLDDYIAEALELRAWQKENWFDGVETTVITPLEF